MSNSRKRPTSIVVGLLSAMIVLILLELLNSKIFPFPQGLNEKDPVAVKNAIAAMPLAAKILHLFCYFIASVVGGMVATKLVNGESKNPAIIVGSILTFFGLVNAVGLGEEIWLAILTLLIYIPGTYLGYLMLRKKQVA